MSMPRFFKSFVIDRVKKTAYLGDWIKNTPFCRCSIFIFFLR